MLERRALAAKGWARAGRASGAPGPARESGPLRRRNGADRSRTHVPGFLDGPASPVPLTRPSIMRGPMRREAEGRQYRPGRYGQLITFGPTSMHE